MKLTERLQLLKAGYSRTEIDAMIREEETPEATSQDTEGEHEDFQEDSSDDSSETEEETLGDSGVSNPGVAELTATIQELQATIKDLQKENLKNSKQPEVENKPPEDFASDILFQQLNIGGNKNG